jgi:nitrogen fixation NifU-like protein
MYAITFARTAARRVSVSRMPQAIAQRAYHENIVEHYENPRNVGSLDKNDDNVGTVS